MRGWLHRIVVASDHETLQSDEGTTDESGRRLVGWALITFAAHAAAEIANRALNDPIGGYHKWIESGGNGNYRPPSQWFFVLVGLWLYAASPVLGIRSLWKGVRDQGLSFAQRAAWIALALLLFAGLWRLSSMGFLSGAIAWS